MGFWEDLTMYLWNWVVYSKQLQAVVGPFLAGGWGLFWDDDDGAMMLWCYELFGNAGMVTYPAYYLSEYAAEE